MIPPPHHLTMIEPDQIVRKFDENFALFHDLMSFKVRDILLISTPYDAFILEEDGTLSQRIINEYYGLNLSAPPRITQVTTVDEAISSVNKHHFDFVLCMPYVGELDAFAIGRSLKSIRPKVPVIVLAPNMHCLLAARQNDSTGVDRIYVWTGDSSLLLAIIKNHEDHVNVRSDTNIAMVRVLVLVEDSPEYLSIILPLLYREVVRQTQAVLEESFNEEHRLLKMRARPKILLASNYEEAVKHIKRYPEYVFCVMSDTRFPRNSVIDDNAGIRLLRSVRKKMPDMPLLLLSSNSLNQKKAVEIPAVFIDKNCPDLQHAIRQFFIDHLGFGDFVFRLPDGREVARAANFKEFGAVVTEVAEESLLYHAQRNHFSNWLMARSESGLATILSTINREYFASTVDMRTFLYNTIQSLRRWRHQGVVANFDAIEFDPAVTEITKIGQGSMGGKARGMAFLATLLHSRQDIRQKFKGFPIHIPQCLVLSCERFNEFIEQNHFIYLCGGHDPIVTKRFLQAALPDSLTDALRAFSAKVTCPLAVRSSSLNEDVQYRPYAGLYKTIMLPNNHPRPEVRFQNLVNAVKLVYASAYHENPRSFSRRIGQSGCESMGVLIQQLVGRQVGDYFYPALSGVAQSYNYYPISQMSPEDGIVSMALGFGKAVVDGEKCLRFSPKYPKVLPQFSSVDAMLENTQRYFYALDMRHRKISEAMHSEPLVKCEVSEAEPSHAITTLCSTYIEEEHRIRDTVTVGPKVVTFARILKYGLFPLTEIITEILGICEQGMGGPVELEFALDLTGTKQKDTLYILQVRPLVVGFDKKDLQLDDNDKKNALCYSEQTLGHGLNIGVNDLVLVKREGFLRSKTGVIAKQISEYNAKISRQGDRYILAGPGRWGSADPMLGIPVQWHEISGVAAIIELAFDQLKVEPSQGTHFFHNITSLGIPYMTIRGGNRTDHFDWPQIAGLTVIHESEFLLHVRSERGFTIKVDGTSGRGSIAITH